MNKGFTLIELVIAMAILGVLTAGMFSLYNTQHKVTHIEEDVVDVQQNLRMAMDSLSKDLRMAGFALTGGESSIALVNNNGGIGGSDIMTINTAAASGITARIDTGLSTTVSMGTPLTFTVSSGEEAGLFVIGNAVRIINPGDRSQPADTAFTVDAVDAAAQTITMTPLANAGAVDFKRGFLIAKTGEGAPDTFPNQVLYCLGPSSSCAPSVSCSVQNCLMRIVNGSPSDSSVIATNIRDLQFRYLIDGSQTEADAPSNLSKVRDVRVSMTGQTVATAELSGTAKLREMTAVAKLRNR
ncbi:MAG: prepilin-type N-terminal cleavage/methylation domain-containing protein [Deltaproteobacteria bacterium]|nr:prepilin-type N-terminal cleavage/methylation domain-containing protein [Deltaproteobacteria bacterium]